MTFKELMLGDIHDVCDYLLYSQSVTKEDMQSALVNTIRRIVSLENRIAKLEEKAKEAA